jgi:hypothetical protein
MPGARYWRRAGLQSITAQWLRDLGDCERCLVVTRAWPDEPGHDSQEKEYVMLWTIAIILVLLWLLGAVVIPVGSALIHALLVIAIIVVIYNLVTRGKATL